ncbi:hypothetical protein GPECTOR_8g346 [Gonium pectorale]|uniref:Haloacid dehalogenase-like hydrolase domain-containing protein 3 n=1 Tax=Gonium pectorale TaxID=33097 RepID=A0A150GT71_GONPE|nr:hypothetical protein GPECTOR_8g346 [Gonium pectorale]|eukprot:KXZ52974.1 hypothetical protein GPECTOR_8g346 [Gonium pectorale]
MDGDEVLQRFRRAYNTPWGASSLRYVGDARPFWRHIVEESTGCYQPEVSEAIYEYYARAEAWHVMPGAVEALQRLKGAGVLLAVVSNFDTRLRPLLRRLGVEGLFDAVIVSAEVLAEKPNPVIFDAAVRALSATAVTRGSLRVGTSGAAGHAAVTPYPVPYQNGMAVGDFGPLVSNGQPFLSLGGPGGTADFAPLSPEQVVHVGDDRRNDCWGARDAGLVAWQWGYDVRSWVEVADRVLLGSQVDEYYENLSYEARG